MRKYIIKNDLVPKVRQPVICANHHVFCSSCMEMWLKKASQCPTCRVPITADSPCREIIGGTNESDHSDSPSMRKCLRKTRGELLLREYEEEIEGLIRENEELKTKNQSLESQLKTALNPCSINTVQTDDQKVDPYLLEEWTNKLRAATDVCDKVKQDMDKLKEANKALRSQNVDLVQENMRLKAEVVSRSPQKFGRYTVAALEAKIQQYERDVDHLQRALKRSDQYIEDLESRIGKSEKKRLDVQEVCESSKAASEAFTQQQKINMMMRSLSDNERGSICSNPETECRTFSRNHSLMFMPSADHKPFQKNLAEEQKNVDLESTSSDFLPTTPSSAFRSLTLRSPGIREKKRSESDEQSCPGPSTESSVEGATSAKHAGDNADSFQMSSEASMDAAYLDKITELDSMMLDDLDSTIVPEPQTCPDVSTSHVGEPVSQSEEKNHPPCDNMDDKEAPKSSAEESFAALGSSMLSGAHVPDCAAHGASSQTDELSFDLLFDSLEENKAGPSGPLSPASQDHDCVNTSSSFSSCIGKPVNTTRTLNISQPTKRKSHSPFTTSSPTKLSKLM
ncbi:RING finger protein 219 [Collichthys lucidus]|uniref:RING finger protein 219 n=1 Tax=Collichthys lucidus TaxID=240159 RepID=A0A4V6AP06_COLLU|nr:RING finger protein 219 [Collichthys lucidus]